MATTLPMTLTNVLYCVQIVAFWFNFSQRYVPNNSIGNKSVLVEMIVYYSQALSHYVTRWWPSLFTYHSNSMSYWACFVNARIWISKEENARSLCSKLFTLSTRWYAYGWLSANGGNSIALVLEISQTCSKLSIFVWLLCATNGTYHQMSLHACMYYLKMREHAIIGVLLH